MVLSPTMAVDIATTIIAGARSDRFPVISATMSITASGAWAMPPNIPIMPMMTKGAGLAGMPGSAAPRRQKEAPSMPPITMPGPKMPPEPPEPIERDVDSIFTNGRASTIHSARVVVSDPIASWTHPYPMCRQWGMAMPIRPTRNPPSAGLSQRGRPTLRNIMWVP